MNKRDLALDIRAALRYAEKSFCATDASSIALLAWGHLGGALEHYARKGDKDAQLAYDEYCRVFGRGGAA